MVSSGGQYKIFTSKKKKSVNNFETPASNKTEGRFFMAKNIFGMSREKRMVGWLVINAPADGDRHPNSTMSAISVDLRQVRLFPSTGGDNGVLILAQYAMWRQIYS